MVKISDASKLYVGGNLASKAYSGANLVWPPPSAYDAATTAWAAAVVTAGGTVSAPRKTLVDNLIVGLKTDSIWAKLDRLWLFAAENTQSALTDLVGLTQATAVNSPTFTTNTGYTGNGTTAYINTGFNPTTVSSHFISVSSSAGLWDITTTAAVGAVQMGSYDGVGYGVDMTLRYVDNNLYVRMSCNNGPGGVAYPGPGLFFGNHAASGQQDVYYNGSSITTIGAVGTPYIPNEDIYVLARNSASGAAGHSADQIAACFFGGSLTATDHANFYTRLRTYMTGCGVP